MINWWQKNVFHIKSTQYLVWSRRNCFENPTESLLHIAQKRWKNFFGKKFIPRKILLDIQKLVLTTLPKRFTSGSKQFCWKSEKDKVNCVFGKKVCFSPNRLFGKLGCSFGNAARRPSLKIRIFCGKIRNDRKLVLFHLTFLFDTFLWGRKIQLWKPCWNLSAKTHEYFVESPNLIEKNSFFQRKFFFFEKFHWANRNAVLAARPWFFN